nr:AIR synthase-related protein [Parvularcula sp. IMCC14364]
MDDTALRVPDMFAWLQERGQLSEADLRRTFNCGIGGVLVVAAKETDTVLRSLADMGEAATVIGELGAA